MTAKLLPYTRRDVQQDPFLECICCGAEVYLSIWRVETALPVCAYCEEHGRGGNRGVK